MQCCVVQLRASPATFHGLMDADRQLDQPREPDLILAFLPSDGNAQDTLAAMAEVWPSSLRVGCETAHQFADAEIGSSGCLQFFWLQDPGHRIWVETLSGGYDDPLGTAEVEAACRGLSEADACLIVADGVRFPLRHLLIDMRRHRASLPDAIAGILASRPAPYDDAETGARVFNDTTVYDSGCLLIGFEGVRMSVRVVRDFHPASPVYKVTRAIDNVVFEIDGETAVDWYRRFFTVEGHMAPMPQTAHAFPLLIEGPDPARRRLCRAMLAFNEPDGAASYWGDVREGEHVRLAIGGEVSLVDTASRLADRRFEAAILFTFAGREALLGEGADGEVAEVHEVLKGISLAGGFSFGEIGPAEDGSLNVQNQTALLVLLQEKVR